MDEYWARKTEIFCEVINEQVGATYDAKMILSLRIPASIVSAVIKMSGREKELEGLSTDSEKQLLTQTNICVIIYLQQQKENKNE